MSGFPFGVEGEEGGRGCREWGEEVEGVGELGSWGWVDLDGRIGGDG